MEHIVRPLVFYALFLFVTSYILKHILAKDSETAILEYKIDMYLNSIKKDIISNYIEAGKAKVGKEHMTSVPSVPSSVPSVPSSVPLVPSSVPLVPSSVPSSVPLVTPYSTFFNTYYLIDNPEKSFGLKTTQFLK
jgi:hypothetical protein